MITALIIISIIFSACDAAAIAKKSKEPHLVNTLKSEYKTAKVVKGSILGERSRDELRRKDIGVVFQTGALITNMTTSENVDFGLRVSDFNSRERKSRVEECLNIAGLLKRIDHNPYELSGGEQQRIAIAIALSNNPKILLADELTGSVDTKTSGQMLDFLGNSIKN